MDELVFQYLPLTTSATEAFGPLKRTGGTVAILLRDRNGQWVLGVKSRFYPEGIVRMLGGGIDQDEELASAAQRELKEETGLDVDAEKLLPLIHADITSADPSSSIAGSVFVFYAQVFQDIQPADDIDRVVYYADRDLNELVNRYAQLPTSPIEEGGSATWSDYGQIWGPIHAAALARVKDLSL